jgi:hypothetical protein
VLIACAPALMWLAAIDRRLMLCCSGVLYALSRSYGWNLPSWPAPGVWFFDPFAWQLLFAVGIAFGLNRRDGVPPLSRPLIVVAGLILAASAVAVTQGFGMARETWESLRGALDIDKSQLGLVRLVHFLALAYLIHSLRLTDRLRNLRFYRPLALLGRHSLWVFALLSLCSAIWQVLVVAVSPTIGFDSLFLGASLTIIYLATRLIEANGAGGSASAGVRAMAPAPSAPPL